MTLPLSWPTSPAESTCNQKRTISPLKPAIKIHHAFTTARKVGTQALFTKGKLQTCPKPDR
jgi:hypothetical protein